MLQFGFGAQDCNLAVACGSGRQDVAHVGRMLTFAGEGARQNGHVHAFGSESPEVVFRL